LSVPLKGSLGKVWFEQIAVPRAARRMKADVLHIPYFGPPRTCHVPTAVTVHDVIQLVVPRLSGGTLTRWYNRLAAAGVRRAQAVIADSEHTKSDVVSRLGVPETRVSRVYLGVELRFSATPDPEADRRVRARYGLDARFLLYMGGLDWRKNVSTLLLSYARAGINYPLAIAGEPRSGNTDAFPDLRSEVRRLGIEDRVRFLGWVADEDQPTLYRAAHLFVFPSRYEGFGLTPLEAMACGAPVLCSNTTSLPEVVGDGALTFGPDDENELTRLLRAVVDDPALLNQLRRRGIEQARRFSWAKTAAETAAILLAVAGGARTLDQAAHTR
ncbi:MAG: glycosyltransferase family 1 protein, partial [Dehalococcoidia bacterium]|nr:glycosyltransferase family 1 protein [Dehalococcoidia bacterium]